MQKKVEKTEPELTKKMAERIIEKNKDFFKAKGLTPKGPIVCAENPAIIANVLVSVRR